MEGAVMRDIIMDVSSLPAIKAAEKMMVYLEPKRDWAPKVLWIYGKSRAGKSRFSKELFDEAYTVPHPKWWQSYDAHKEVVFENFTDEFISCGELLRIVDRYPYVVENKGGSRQLLAQTIVFNSVHPPEDCYVGHRQYDEFQNRIKEFGVVIELDVKYTSEGPRSCALLSRMTYPHDRISLSKLSVNWLQ